MLIFVRHGKTISNEIGNEKLRGWLPVPLTLEGMAESHETAERLAQFEGEVKDIRCGTLVRVVQSATELSEVFGKELKPMEELNDWNTGDFAGKPVKETLDDLHSHIKEPNKKVPGGEPFQFFLDRIVPLLKKYVESTDITIVISSGRVSTLLKALSVNKGKHPSTEVLLGKPPIDPSGIYILDEDWTVAYADKKSEESKGLS